MCPTKDACRAFRSTYRRHSLCREMTRWGVEMAGTIVKFEDLPANARALLLAKLAVALRAQNSASIYDLAETGLVDVVSLWRSICRKARQPVCTIPVGAIGRH